MRDWLNGAAGGGQKKEDGQKGNKKKTIEAGKKGKTTTTSASKKTCSKESVTSKTSLSKKVTGPSLPKLSGKSASKVSESASKEVALSRNVKVKAVGTIAVRLNVYSLVKVNEKLKYTGIGIYHSGTEVHNCEWAYGGHPLETSGIFQMVKPRDLKSLSDIDGNFVFMQTQRIGCTTLSLEQVNALVSVTYLVGSVLFV